MLKKNKNIIFGMIAASILLAVFLIVKHQRALETVGPVKVTAHHGQIKSISLEDTRVDAFYFVPKDFENSIDSAWKQHLENALSQTKLFYEKQVGGGINITYNIFPTPILGKEDSTFYNGNDTSQGNPSALILVYAEIQARIASDINVDGNSFSRTGGTFHPSVILYEGVGASAMLLLDTVPKDLPKSHVVAIDDSSAPAFLISDYFFTGDSYKDYGTTFFAHEFGHIIGLVDAYTGDTGFSTSEDIMGMGRFKPLNATYLDDSSKKLLLK